MVARPTLVAVDTNVLLDLAVPKDRAHDAIAIFRRRVPGIEFVVPPTVIEELDFIPVGHGIVEAVARKLRGEHLIPEHEANDSFILAEAALANCSILISSDEHLRSADPTRLSLALKSCDVNAVLVRTPREIVRQFG